MKRVLQIAIALVLTALLLYFVVDAREVAAVLRRCDPAWSLLTIVFLMADRALMTFKWGLLLRVRGYQVPLLSGMMVYCSAMVWGLALPSTVGADAIRAVLMRRHAVEVSDSIATILVERAIGFVCALAMGLLSIVIMGALLPHVPFYDVLLLGGGIAILAALLALALSFSERAFETMLRIVPRAWRGHRLVARFRQLHAGYRSLGGDRQTMVAFTLLTLLEQLAGMASIWMGARALSMEVDFLYILAATPLAFLAARLPVSFDGIGVYEGIFVAVMTLSGLDPAQSFALAVWGRVLNVAAWLPWFVAYVFKSGSIRPPSMRSVSTPAPDEAIVNAP